MQFLEKYSTTVGILGLALSEEARRVTDWRREMVEPGDRQQ